METFKMADIISLLDIQYPPYGKSSYYVTCPCCDNHSKYPHMNINVAKGVFRCARCGVSGGMFDLYSLYTGIPRDRVYKALVDRLAPNSKPPPRKVQIAPQPIVQEYPITDIDTRHATYSALLKKLSLSNDHLENLRSRGLKDEEIEALAYRTTPIAGMSVLAKQLRAEGYYLSGVPGFYRTEANVWSFIKEQRGILVPVRDIDGRIQGLQIRRDNAVKRKFRWVSSTDMKDGCKAEGSTHLAGTVDAKLILTEGPMKADVIHALTGATVLAVPGVNALTKLKSTLEQMRERGLMEIQTAFDMDFCVNPHVQNGYNNLLALLDKMGFKFGTYIWDSRYKGLDDFIWECQMNRTR